MKESRFVSLASAALALAPFSLPASAGVVSIATHP